MLPTFLSAIAHIYPHQADRIFIDPPACILPTLNSLGSHTHTRSVHECMKQDEWIRSVGETRVHQLATQYYQYPSRVIEIVTGKASVHDTDQQSCVDYWKTAMPTWYTFRSACIAAHRIEYPHDHTRTNAELEIELDRYPYNDVVRIMTGIYTQQLPLVPMCLSRVPQPHRTILQNPYFGYDVMDALRAHSAYDMKRGTAQTLISDQTIRWIQFRVPAIMDQLRNLAKCDRDIQRLSHAKFTENFTTAHITTSRVHFWGDDPEPIGIVAITHALRKAIGKAIEGLIPEEVEIDVTSIHPLVEPFQVDPRVEIPSDVIACIAAIFAHNVIRVSNEMLTIAKQKTLEYPPDPTEEFDTILSGFISSMSQRIVDQTAWYMRDIDPIIRTSFDDPELPPLTLAVTSDVRVAMVSYVLDQVFPTSKLLEIIDSVVWVGSDTYRTAYQSVIRMRRNAQEYATERVKEIEDYILDSDAKQPERFVVMLKFLSVFVDTDTMPKRNPRVMALYALYQILSQPKCPPSATSIAK